MRYHDLIGVSAKRAYVFELCGVTRRYESFGGGALHDETSQWGSNCQPVDRKTFVIH